MSFMLCVLSATAFAQPREISIWPGDAAPGSENWTHKEVTYAFTESSLDLEMVRNVVRPTLTVYLPERRKANGTGIVVAPGGGMRFLSWESEGTAVAQWLAARGVTAFVLKYRLLQTPADPQEFAAYTKAFSAELAKITDVSRIFETEEMRKIFAMAVSDGAQAVKYVRAHAGEWGIAADRIGMMGFSAGAYVTMGVAMSHDPASRLNFAASIYGGETGGSNIPADAPPLFLLVAQDDRLIYKSTQKLYLDWSAANRPVDLHSFSQGGHGFGMLKQGLPVDDWIDLYGAWLDSLGLMKPGDRPHQSSIRTSNSADDKE